MLFPLDYNTVRANGFGSLAVQYSHTLNIYENHFNRNPSAIN